MIRLLFTFLLVAFLSPLAIAQTCNKDLALGKAVTTSSVTAGNIPTRATDGDPTSRWESAWNNNEWIMVDLGQSYPLCTITLNWQVLATGYTVEVSPDGTSWTNLVTETANTGLNKTYSVSANGRYVRMTGLTRGSAYGFSLYDFIVIGTEPINYCSNTNVAQLRPVTVSSVVNGNTGNFAVDNNMGTRWESAHSDNQYMYVDLGANYDLCRVVLNWEAAYGKDYTIDISSNGSTWTTVKTVTGNYMRDNTLDVSGNARYVRMNGQTRGSTYGFSIYEFSVYALLPAVNVTKVTDAAEPGTGGSFRFSLPTGITFTEPITVNYTTTGTATSGTDYTALSGSVVIPAGQQGVNVPLSVIDDQIIEGNETVITTITNATSTTRPGFPISATNPSATMTIADNDNIAANKILSITPGTNGAEPSTNGSYTISLPAGITSAESITVNYTTSGTATAGTDYSLPATFILPAGQNSTAVTLTVTDDQIIENTETAIVTLTGGTTTTLGAFTVSTTNATASVSITDDDNTAAKKTIRIIRTAHAAEPSTNGGFRIYLPTGITVSEDVTITANITGSATPGTDYVALSSTFVIPAGQNSVVTPVQVIDDNEIESTETVTVSPTAASSTSFGSFPIVFGATATINITDDDDIPANRRLRVTKTIDAVEGASNGNFRISLPAGVSYPADITVNYTISGTAVGGTDYTTIPATATIPAGQNGVDVAITAIPYNNDIIENDKTVIMTLTGGSAPSFSAFTPDPANTTATVIIADDDSNATNKRLSVYNIGMDAAEPSTAGAFQIRLPGTLRASEPITVSYTITPSSSAGTTPATPGTDFNNLTGTVTIPAGQNAVNVPYSPIDDQIIETREEFTVQLTGGTTPTLGAFGVDVATGVMAIDDNDNIPANKIFTITPTVTAAEPSTNGSFTVSLPAGYTVSQNVTFYYTVGGTATPGIDYTGIGTSVILTAGQNSVQINVPVIDDNIIEGTESIDVTPTSGASADITGFTSSGTASNTIADDDNTATNKVISIVTANNGSEPSTNGTFTISLPTGITSATPVTVNFAVSGTATAGTDYTALGTSIIIPANQNSVTLTVPVLDDQAIEGTETVIVTITGGTAPAAGTFTASATNAVATVNIADDDNTPANRVISIANANNGGEPATNGAFTVSLPTGVTLTEDVTVNFSVTGTATPGNDYTSLGTSIIIPAGQNSTTLSVPVLDDQIIETTETVIVTITGGTATTAGTFTAGTSNVATVDITDNDNTLANKTISITTANDGSEPSSNGAFTVSLPTGVTNTEDVTVNFTVAGTATAGTDYTSLGTSLTIPAGQNSASLIVPVLDDQLIEGTETVIVTITGGTATTAGAFTASATNATAAVNINDDDNTATNKVISIVAANDGSEPATNAAFTISLPTGVTVNEPVTVNFTVAGSATSGTDYTAIGTSITIPAGQNSVTLTVPVLDDQLIEGTETVVVTVTGGTATAAGGFTAGTSNTATVNINDNDDVAANKVISIANANDGAEPGTNGAFNISLPAGITAAEPITVNFTVAGTATAGNDYTALGVSAIIPAGQNNVTLTVPVLDDQIIESTETVIVTVTGGSATTAGAFTAGTSNTATVNINDNDNTAANKVISIVAANDGTEPATSAAFTVSLPTGVTADEDITVNFSVAGTATAGADYTALGTTATILAGQNSATLTVPVLDDQIIEPTETVIVTVTGGSATNGGAFTASVANANATVNINDDDNTPANKVISITTANNGDEPSNNGAFTISLPTGVTVNEDVTVNFTVAGTATAGTDYTALGTSVIIPAGQNSVTLTVPVLDDQIIEGTESVTVTITGGSATSAGAFTAGTNNVATVNINDDDNTATNKVISITAANDGTEPATNAAFTISLPAGITVNEDVTVNFTVAGTATAGNDYTAIGTSATILAGQNSVTLTVPVLDDQIIESPETVIVTITGGSAANAGTFTANLINGTATVNINDDDNSPANKVISIVAANDGTEPASNAAFTISLPTGVTADEDITVNFSVAGTATAGADYTALGTTATILAGQNSATLTVPVLDDQIIEATETVIVTVTGGSATNAGAFTVSVTNATATVNISDDDNTAANKIISIITANNGDEPSNNGAFTISLPTGVTVNEDVTVNFTVAGTATAGTDYTALGTSVIIPAGQNSITLTVPILDDQIIEGTESVTVTITGGSATGAGAFTAGTNNIATVNINDDDNTATNKVISITAANDGTEPATNAAFTISLPAGVTVNEDVTVNFTVAGTATAGNDYTAIGTSATILAGQNSVTLTVPVLDDQIIESPETVIVTITGGSATNAGAFTANPINGTATVNINDDDNTAANKVISIVAANDGTEPATNAAFTVSLPTGVTADEDITVNFSVAGTATAGTDHTALGTSIIIPAGQNSVTLNVPVLDDQVIEATETVIVTVTGGSATNAGAFTANVANATATVNINDDDNTPANKIISITTANNGDEPSNNGAFTISLPTGVTVNEDVTVNFTTAGTATAGTDYTALGTSVIIPAGQNSVTLNVPVMDDQIIEGTESVTVTITGGSATAAGAFTAGTNNVATVNINDNDNTAANKVISIAAANDSTEPATNAAFTISLPAGVTVNEDVTVNFTVTGTATAGTDYTALGSTVTIPAGQNSVTLNVPVLDDQVIEATETVIVNVTGGTATAAGAFTASAANATATVNITDNDNTVANKVISITRTADGSEPSSNGAFSISLPAGVSVSEDLNIIYNIAGSAINGTDYSILNGTITLPAGQNSIALPVIVTDDNIIEGAESVVVTIANASATSITGFTVSVTNRSATVIIADEDNTTTNRVISINPVTDGSEPATNGSFAISLPTGITAAEDITVNYTVTGTATAGADYTALGTSVIIPAGQNSVTLTVPVLDDQIIESTETVVVNITGGTTISIGSFTANATNATATVNISDNDNTAANKLISIVAANDGAEPATNGAFTISLPTGVTVNEDVTVNFTTAGTATAGTDYSTPGTTITIPAGQNSVTLTVPVLDDQIIESTETVIVTVTGGSATAAGAFTASATNANATINITDNDNIAANKVISITAANDGAEPGTNGAFTISLPTGVTVNEDVTVNFTVAGTATGGTDYTALGTSITIPAGQNSVTLNVPVMDDQVIESVETVIVTVTGGSATNAGAFNAGTTNTATVNISDDDNTVANKVISITTANDGAEPATNGAFTISLPTGVTVNEDVTVNFTVTGTATAGADYTAFGASVIIPAGQNSITLTVPVRDDQAIEATETVIATITGGTATNAGAFTAGTNNTATVNISDDDNTAANKIISIAAANDGAEPSTNGAFTISLPTGVTVNEDVTVNFTTAGTATTGTDYTALSTSIIIPAGQNSVTLTVPVLDDQIIESTETVIVTVTGGTGATTGAFTASATNATATINIGDDDNTPANKAISIVAANDGSEPSTNGAFTISLPTGVTVNEDVTVNFTVAGTATAGTDYTSLGTTIIIPAGQNSVTLTVPVLDDQAIEATETVIATITGGTATNAGAFTAGTNNTATVNISDDDNTAANKIISIAAANDGAEPSTNGAFTISLPTGVTVNEDVTVNFTVAGTATAGADYSSLGSTVIIPAGQNSATLTVPVLDDQIIESTETVIVTITGGTAAATGTFTASTTNANATVNISDDDNTATNRIINVSNTNDGSEPATNGNFSISLPAGIIAAEDIIVNYTLAGTATAGTDYTTSGTTVTIPAGQNSVALPIVVNDDLLMEGDETVIITITGGTTATLGAYTPGTASATLLIADDENTTANKVLSISRNADAAEPSKNGSFTVSLPAGISATENISVNYTIGGTATAGTDYATLSGSVIIPAGQNSANIDVMVNDDQLIEGNETVIATITGGTGTALGTFTVSSTNNTATVTISDDDNTAANTTISIITLNDAAEPGTTGNFTISLPTGITAVEDITVTYNTSGTATPGADYVALSGNIIIPAGQNSVTLPVTVTDDGLMEGTETVIVGLSGASATTLGTFTISTTNAQATVNINDDDNSVVRFETWKTAALPADNIDGKIGQGEQITYTIFIRNTGNVNIPSLSVQDPVPAYTAYVSGGALIGNNVHFNIVDLQPNAVSQVSFVVQTYDNLNGVQNITNVAQISDGSTTLNTVACDPSDPNCNGGNQTIVPVREPQGDLVISKQAVTQPTSGQYYALGENITYEIKVSNVGEKTFTNIAITDSLPASLDMPSYYISSKGSIIASPAARKVITSVDQLLPGEEVTITITCRVNNKEIVNTAYVQAAETETDLSNNTAVATAAASIRDLAFINAFRPGNGANNRFVIVGLEKYPGSKLLVYSRWGSLVYQSNDYKNDWRALDLPMGSYIYVAEVKKPEGVVIYKGDFIIIR